MKKYFATIAAFLTAGTIVAGIVNIDSFSYYGPYPVKSPVIIDSLDVKSKAFERKQLLDHADFLPSMNANGEVWTGALAPAHDGDDALHYLMFTLENNRFFKGNLDISGLKDYKVFVDGKKISGKELKLSPATHRVVIKYLSSPSVSDSLSVKIEGDGTEKLAVNPTGKRMFTLHDVTDGTRISSVSVSPDGKYMIAGYSTTLNGGKTTRESRIISTADGKVRSRLSTSPRWMPRGGSRYYFTRQGVEGREMIVVDAVTGDETVLADNLPEGYFSVSPDESCLVFSVTQNGPEEGDVYQIVEPDDRQPGWRNRSSLARYDLATGTMRQLTFGHRNLWLNDISTDGKKLLVTISKSRLTQRPTTLNTVAVIDMETMEMKPVVEDDGFIGRCVFSPDASQILVTGSPESFSGIGKNLPEGRIPSMTDNQLYIVSVDGGDIKPVTKNFDPSVESFAWNRDGNIYFRAENRDRYSFYSYNPKSDKFTMIPVPEDLVNGFDIASGAPVGAWYGQSVSNPDRLYTIDTRSLKSRMIDSPKGSRFDDVAIAECNAWNFKNSRGDSIYGRFYLPPGFDASEKYPLIVNYYGGCSPTSRTFESRYPHNAYAALGYVVYVIEPSGATGFGQEFSSRHVNTAGQGVADDIIEGTKLFCKEHPYVDSSKIGCIGASYGGFMTQYLQTVTDIFAAAISHAGISDHTSYWGEGYWGYSYSEVCMAESYPWSHPDLFVKQSPLFNADKIHTPLLFLHGDSDTNVPFGESIQMFNALKLLGRETAFVAVKGENHHILDYDKRFKWQDTIFAWFAKWLQNDSSWWEEMYPSKSL